MADPRRSADRTRIDSALAARVAAIVAERDQRGTGPCGRAGFGDILGAPEAAVHECVAAVRDARGRVSLRYAAFTEIRVVDGRGRLWMRTQLVAGQAAWLTRDWTDVTEPA